MICKKSFSVYPSYIERGGGLYCSRACKDIAQSQYMKSLPKEKRPHYQGKVSKIKCVNCGGEFETKTCLIKERNFCSKSCANSYNVRQREKRGQILECRVCKGEFYRLPSAINRESKKPKYCSQSCRAIDSIRNQRKNGTDIEQMLGMILADLGLKFEKQKPIQGICLSDFFVLPNICIFADGDYWHSKEERVKIDQKQKEELIEAGYRVIRLKGKDILSNNVKDKRCHIIS